MHHVTCDDVFQGAILPLAYLGFHLPLFQLCYQVHLGHLRHSRSLEQRHLKKNDVT